MEHTHTHTHTKRRARRNKKRQRQNDGKATDSEQSIKPEPNEHATGRYSTCFSLHFSISISFFFFLHSQSLCFCLSLSLFDSSVFRDFIAMHTQTQTLTHARISCSSSCLGNVLCIKSGTFGIHVYGFRTLYYILTHISKQQNSALTHICFFSVSFSLILVCNGK